MDVPSVRRTNWGMMPALGVIAVGVALTLLLWQHSVREYRQQRQADFEARNATVERTVRQRLGVYSQTLRSAVALFDASDDVSRDSWRRFVAGMQIKENYPGLFAMAYARAVDDAALPGVVAQARRDGIAEFGMYPPGRRERYVLNVYAEPMNAGNRRALGYDMYQDAERRRVMDLARDTATPRITARIGVKIDTESNPRPAFIMYLPVYQGGTPATLDERRARLSGFVLCPFRMPELMPAVLGPLVDDLGFALYDGDIEDDAHLFYRNAAFDAGPAPLLRQRRELVFGGRRWTMAFHSTPAFEASPGYYWPYAVLGIGGVVTFALAAILFLMASARHRAIVLAGEMTQSLRLSEARLQSLFSQAPLGILSLDPQGNLTDCNAAACIMFGASREQMLGFNPLAQARDAALKPWLVRGLAGEPVTFESQYLSTIGDKSGYFRFHFQPIRQNGEFSMLQCFVEDISQQHQAVERIARLAHHDSLTGLANRAQLNDRLAQAILAAHRENLRLAVLFLDLDNFKTINDSLGHTQGDAILIEIARRIGDSLRDSDTIARLGGDEFVILLRDVGDSENAARVAEKVMECVAAPLMLGERSLDITGSIGIALYPEDGGDIDTLIKNADAAMYHAKEAGRNNFQFFTPDMNARVVEALAMEAALRYALRNNEFLLHYQPQLSIDGGSVVGMEALIRWQRPGVGMISPAQFIPVAESRGLIVALGEWVINEACRQNRCWQAMGLPPIPVAVNVSTLQLRNNALVQTVRAALADSGLDARYLELEITESALAQNIEFATALMRDLKALGVQISIDDFGTGYSSLSYLKRFPIDKLKIDQSFTRDLTTDRDDAAITQAIVAMGKNLGMKVIAEGVETLDQLHFLQRHGCDEAQGYLFSRPLAADAMEAFLAQRYAA